MTKSPTESQVTLMTAGKTSRALLREFGPTLAEQHNDALSRLKSRFRLGDYTESQLASGLAELCAIDDLIERLNAKVNVGDSTQKEFNNA